MAEEHWLTTKRAIRRLWIGFIVLLVATVVAELFVDAHPHFDIERVFAFNALYGFLACAALILGAKLIGLIVKRPDSYYEDHD